MTRTLRGFIYQADLDFNILILILQKKNESADFNVKYGLDTKVNEPRILFVDNNNRVMLETIRLNKDSTSCTSKEVYLRVS